MKTYIIAEAGINHNGDIGKAMRLIDSACEAGCDAVKFQKRNPDICVPEHQKGVVRSTPWGEMTYLDYKKKIEFGSIEYDAIDSYCKARNIDWSASPWDLDSLKFVAVDYDVPWIKIPSACLTDDSMLWACVEINKPVIISTGMSMEDEIERAVLILRHLKNKLTILHCNSTYPTPMDEVNLKCISTLKRYGEPVGYSGHEEGINATIASVCLGAEVIERHITLDKTLWGTDQSSSLEPQELKRLVLGIREVEQALGDGKIGVTKSEETVREKLRI